MLHAEPLSKQERAVIQQWRDDGDSLPLIADRLGVHQATIRRLLTGETQYLQHRSVVRIRARLQEAAPARRRAS
jgi:IS30 family transposase